MDPHPFLMLIRNINVVHLSQLMNQYRYIGLNESPYIDSNSLRLSLVFT